eukprot:COSAG02_NODE_6849_length_3328_cov_35.645401_4_plen_236_part_00
MGRFVFACALMAVGALGGEDVVLAIANRSDADIDAHWANLTAPGVSISRAEIQSRALSWVKNKVPYCQCNSDCCGKCPYCGSYRCDCSGLVTYAWNAKAGLTTRSLGSVSHTIKVSDLQVGDALLSAGHHVILFNGWQDKPNLRYYALQEAGCQSKLPHVASNTVGKIPGPPYVPVRYNSVHESAGQATVAERAKWQESASLPLPTEEEERELLSQAGEVVRNGTWEWIKAIGEQ